jgi:hypothetical protein
VIDPSSIQGWNDVGLFNIERAGYRSLVEFYNEPSHHVLPRLEMNGQRIGVAFIDGWHTFDYVLVDFFYVDRILDVGGVVMFDDTRWYPAIRKVARYVATHRRYTPLPNEHTPFPPSPLRRILQATTSILRNTPLRQLDTSSGLTSLTQMMFSDYLRTITLRFGSWQMTTSGTAPVTRENGISTSIFDPSLTEVHTVHARSRSILNTSDVSMMVAPDRPALRGRPEGLRYVASHTTPA